MKEENSKLRHSDTMKELISEEFDRRKDHSKKSDGKIILYQQEMIDKLEKRLKKLENDS